MRQPTHGHQPALPRLFVIGDSISLHYGPYLERFVKPWFEYARKSDEVGAGSTGTTVGSPGAAPGDATAAVGSSLDYPFGPYGENAGDSGMVLAYLRTRHASLDADVVLLNCGLHDLKTDPSSGRPQVALADYRDNLRAIVDLVAGARFRLVWATITPVVDETHALHAAALGFERCQADVERYNAAASAVMRAAGVAMVDLHAFTTSLGQDVPSRLYSDHVHYVDGVREAQAAFLAGWLVATAASG